MYNPVPPTTIGWRPPERASAYGSWEVPGQAVQVADDALALQDAGCFAIVFEAVPAEFTEAVMPHIEIPVIGIGAGPFTDGQVLVFHDLLGITTEPHNPRFVKRYAEIHDRMVEGVRAYAAEVRSRRFPDAEHVYSVDPAEVEELRRYLEQESLATSPWDW